MKTLKIGAHRLCRLLNLVRHHNLTAIHGQVYFKNWDGTQIVQNQLTMASIAPPE